MKYHILLFLVLLLSITFYFKSRTPQLGFKSTQLPKIAVTGSNGSVGKRTVLRALKHGYHVVGIDHSPLATADDQQLGENFSFLQVDLRDYNETLKVR